MSTQAQLDSTSQRLSNIPGTMKILLLILYFFPSRFAADQMLLHELFHDLPHELAYQFAQALVAVTGKEVTEHQLAEIQILAINYWKNSSDLDSEVVGLGDEMTADAVADQVADVMWRWSPFNYDPDSLYMVIMLDPDGLCPSEPKLRSALHFLVGNMKFNDLSSGKIFAPYMSPGPLPGTGAHRYTLLVYKQWGNTPVQYPCYPLDIPHRINFNLTQFLERNSWVLQQRPIASTYYTVENPEAYTGEGDPCDPNNYLDLLAGWNTTTQTYLAGATEQSCEA